MNYRTLSFAEEVSNARQVSHDLRSPIMLLSAIFKSQDDICTKKRTLALKALQRLHSITEDLLGIQKAEAPTPYHLADMIQDIIEEKNHTAPKHIKFEFANLLPHNIQIDCRKISKLQRILSNLINNSAESMAKNANGFIEIRARYSAGMCRISISDNGRGIPKNILSRVGEHGFSYGKKGGHGLGLSHAIETMRKWNGFTEIQSEMGVGTEVTLTFPD